MKTKSIQQSLKIVAKTVQPLGTTKSSPVVSVTQVDMWLSTIAIAVIKHQLNPFS